MNTSALRAQPRVHQSAFTLIELLVVLVIVALLASVVVLSFNRRDQEQEVAQEAQRLAVTIEMAKERAMREALEWGLDVGEEGYRFLRYSDATGRWQAVDQTPFRLHRLKEGLMLTAKVDTLRLPEEDKGLRERPDVLLLSSGESSAFQINIALLDGSASWLVESDGIATTRANNPGTPQGTATL